jgi:RHS repeat-associated protein
MTTANGALDSSIAYFPFGSARTGSVNSEKQFTGQMLDATGLYYYNARYYDPTIGRFISPDNIIQNYENPQTLNRYSYCANNPLNGTDPTGLDYISDHGGMNTPTPLEHPTRTGFIVRLFDIFTHPNDWVIEQGINTVTGAAGPKVDIVPSVVDKNDIPESQQAAYNFGQTMADVTVQTGIAMGTGCLASSCSSLPAATNDISFNWLDKGSTGRTTANTAAEQAAWDEVMKDPLKDAQPVPIKLGDTRWSYNDGWIKYEREFVEARIHFNYNPWIDAFDDFKFKSVGK